ncbi:MAG: NAD(P)-dependent oxidoreductase [Planctomycetota bacterium]|jgi:3-hydroxyisobutyrate dehydrogenase
MPGERIGFIGTGIMGRPMALNLLKAGYAVTVHNRTKSRAGSLLSEGAVWAETPAEGARENDVVITCVPDTPDVRQVLLGANGVIEGARAGLICVDMSTISPAVTKEMGGILEAKGVTLLDGPISGGEIGAIEGKLSIMMGGPKEAFEKVRPIMEVMGKAVIHCGPLGAGQMTKLVNQVMVIHTIMSIAEGLAFAEKAGLDLETTWQVTSAGAAGSHSLKVLGRKIIDGDLKPAFMVDLQQKDLRLVMELADELKQPLPGVALAKQLLGALQAQGRGRDGTQAMIDVIRQLGEKPS